MYLTLSADRFNRVKLNSIVLLIFSGFPTGMKWGFMNKPGDGRYKIHSIILYSFAS